MTKTEFLALQKHALVKYTGTRPAEGTFFFHHSACSKLTGKPSSSSWGVRKDGCHWECTTMPKTFLTKGVVVTYVREDTWNPATKGDITLYFYGGSINKLIPAEWTLVDERKWVVGEMEYKRAKSYIPAATIKFKEDLKVYLENYKRRLEYKVDELPIDKKLKIIMELSPEDRKWFGIMTMSPEDTIKAIEKAFEEDA